MASIVVTTYTYTLIDEAEKQAKVSQSHPTLHEINFSFLKLIYFAAIVVFYEG